MTFPYSNELQALIDVCESLGLKTVVREDKQEYGAWMWKDNEIHFSFPDRNVELTVAHELGHALTLDRKPERFATEYMNLLKENVKIPFLNDNQRRTVLQAEIRAWRVGLQVLRVIRQHLGTKLTPEQVKAERRYRTECINTYRDSMRVPSAKTRKERKRVGNLYQMCSPINYMLTITHGLPKIETPTFAPYTYTFTSGGISGPLMPILVSGGW